MPEIVGVDIAAGAQVQVNAAPVDSQSGQVVGVQATGTLTVADYTAIKVDVQASGTITLSGQPSVNDTVTVNGQVYTFKSTPLAQRDVLIGGTAALTAQNLKAAINAFSKVVVASGASNIITVTAVATGTGGNALTLTKSGANLAVSGATLAGGVNADTISVYGRSFKFVTGATSDSHQIQKGSSNNDAASKIATKVNAIPQETNVTAVAVNAVITLTAVLAGTTGNSIALLAANATAFTLSAATLAGGVNASAGATHYALLVKQADAAHGAAPASAKTSVALSTTDGAVVAAVVGKKIVVLALAAIAGATATDITFNSKPAGAGTAISPLFSNNAHAGVVLPYNPAGWFATGVGEGLSATTGAGSATGVLVTYALV